ncbi:hypothetical protein [Paenibacillus typhae]|uniref:Uncharacterized protein n=1 Tax=Paenibacillus typhae TaxID=1174501 RepID=A0A1G8H9K8_9BACL|nr:hypothetical protein [Paenibacillus typhae]SDI03332.1 hypothetical protein SAMN05216192_102349 [Paenibacillus typhae]
MKRRERAAVLPTRNGVGVVRVSSDPAHVSLEADENGEVEPEELRALAQHLRSQNINAGSQGIVQRGNGKNIARRMLVL